MNIALSILSAAASAEAAGTAEAYSGPWENVYNAVHSTAEAVTEEAQGVVDRIQGLGDAHAQLADPDYWGSVGIYHPDRYTCCILYSRYPYLPVLGTGQDLPDHRQEQGCKG